MDLARAKRLNDMMQHPGWQDARAIIQEIKEEISESMNNMIDKDRMTLNKAHKLHGMRKALNRFEDELAQAPRILTPPTPKRGGRSRAVKT